MIGGAEASDASPPLFVNPATGQPFPINLSTQIAGYLAALHGHQAPENTTALINAGVEHIILCTLPDFGFTPNAQAAGPLIAAFAHELDVINNTALEQVASAHPNVQVVDFFQMSEATFTDPTAFGFNPNLNFTWTGQLQAGTHQFAPNEIAFFDGEHPTSAAHGVLAAFADAVLTSDTVQLLDGAQTVIHAGHGDNFIFATPPEPGNLAVNVNYTIYGGAGDDIIYGG